MTNAERHRRHLSGTDVCQVCKGGVETILHVLRDCPAMEGIWNRLVTGTRRHTFFSMSLLEWLSRNLCNNNVQDGIPWATTFAVAVWWGWKWRCWNVFGKNKLWRDRVKFLRNLAREVTSSKKMEEVNRPTGQRVELMIGWKPPRVGWMKLNTDGASQGNLGLASAGGMLRDGDGEWCGGFALDIGRYSAPLAELWEVYYGLVIAWREA